MTSTGAPIDPTTTNTQPYIDIDNPYVTFACDRPDADTIILYTLNSESPTPSNSLNVTCSQPILVPNVQGTKTVTIKAYTVTGGGGADGAYVQDGSVQSFTYDWAFKSSYSVLESNDDNDDDNKDKVEVTNFRFKTGNNVHHTGRISSGGSVTVLAQRDRSEGGTEGEQRTARDNGRYNGCKVAMNGGFFNPDNGETIGDYVITENTGELYVKVDERHVNVGIGGDGVSVQVGYVSNLSNLSWFVSGCLWLVRNGTPYLDTSVGQDDVSVQTTGMPRFKDVLSARTAACVNGKGGVEWVVVEGKTDVYGISLGDLSVYLAEIGYLHCVNLDGGGSVSKVYEGEVDLVTPGYECDEGYYKERCSKPISTVVCLKGE